MNKHKTYNRKPSLRMLLNTKEKCHIKETKGGKNPIRVKNDNRINLCDKTVNRISEHNGNVCRNTVKVTYSHLRHQCHGLLGF